jgi:PAS domain S-box-containing protein
MEGETEKPLRILLVDDNPDDRRLIVRELHKDFGDIDIRQIPGVEQLDRALQEGQFDLVITDYRVGWIDGLEVLYQVKLRYPNCPVIMFTGTGSEEVAVEAMKMGLDDYVIKTPAHFARLSAAVKSVLEKAHQRQKLEEAEARYQKLFEEIPIGLFRISADGKILEANATFLQLFGYQTKEELVGKRITEFYKNPADRKKLLKKLEKDGMVRDFEVEFIRKDGTSFWAELNVSAIRDESGEIAFHEGSIDDITPRKVALKALQESEEKFRTLVNFSSDGIYVAQDGKIVFTNPRIHEWLGYTAEEITSPDFDILSIIEEKDRPVLEERWEAFQRGDYEPRQFSFTALTREGKKVDVEVFEARITWEGRPAILGTLRNVTERNRLEAQLRQAVKMEAIGRLSGGIAHDFNNLLTIINGYSEMLLNTLSPEDPIRNDVLEIHKAGVRAAELTRQLLAFSRRHPMEFRVMNLNDVVRGLEKMLRRVIGEHIQLHIQTQKDLWNIKADPGQMEQVIMNIVVNARDAMPDGGTLTIRTENAILDAEYARSHPGVEAGEYVLLTIADTGIGIAPDIQDKIFEPFFTTKQIGEGTGLGLSTAYGIVRQTGGHIRVYSEPEKGSTFLIYLPRTKEELEHPIPKEGLEHVPRGNETVLVVEDEDIVLRLVVKVLTRLGYRVLTARTGRQAVELLKDESRKIDLVLSDVVMPEMSGSRLVEEVEKCCPDTRILFMSGYSHEIILRGSGGKRSYPYIQKPFTPVALGFKVREVLDGRHGPA